MMYELPDAPGLADTYICKVRIVHESQPGQQSMLLRDVYEPAKNP